LPPFSRVKLTENDLSTDLTATQSGFGKSRIEGVNIYARAGWDPLQRAAPYTRRSDHRRCGTGPLTATARMLAQGAGRGWVCWRLLCCCRAFAIAQAAAQRKADRHVTIVAGQNPQEKSKTNPAKDLADLRAIRARPADHSRDATLQATIGARFGPKIAKPASRRSEHHQCDRDRAGTSHNTVAGPSQAGAPCREPHGYVIGEALGVYQE
jgi:hypothetical protein